MLIIFAFLFKFTKFINIAKTINIMNSNIKNSIKIIIKKNHKNRNNRKNRENRNENRNKKIKKINKN